MSATDTTSSDAPAAAPLPPPPAAEALPPPRKAGGRRGMMGLALIAACVVAAAWFALRGGDATAPARHATPMHPPVGASAAHGGAAFPGLSASQVERGVQRAREETARDPANAAAWAMLAHGAVMQRRFDEAREAYARLLALRPQDAQVHAEAAEDLGLAQGGSLAGEPQRLIARALEIKPGHLKARVLAGKASFEQKRYGEAAGHWERGLAAAGDPAVRRQLETSIAEAKALAAPQRGASAVGGLAFVTGRVTVAPALQARLRPDDAVFVFARPAEGSRMPVALLRRRAAELPLDFALDDTLALVPQTRLSEFKQVVVGVRVSRRGDAIATSGDLQGPLGPVAVGSTGLRLEVTDVVP
ncbi:MAG: hypothetical protein IT181_25585 [Acidobacteria bacterium]|nr:hypothetical protein [Acidobacteriota bacterium]